MSFETFLSTVSKAAVPAEQNTFVEAETHSVDANGVYFTVPGWDSGKHLFGPAKWQAQEPPPSKGDPLLILFIGGGVERAWVVVVGS